MGLLDIQDVPSWYPGPLLRTLSLPVDEVLEAPPLAAGTQQTVNSEGRANFNHPGGGCDWEAGINGLSQKGLIFNTWKMGWIRMVLGNFRCAATGLMTFDDKWPDKSGTQFFLLYSQW